MKLVSEKNLLGFIALAGLLAMFAKLSLLKNPTVEGHGTHSRKRRRPLAIQP
jgi:hypothetical protein